MQEEQKKYNEFVETTSPVLQEVYNGGNGLSSSEFNFIQRYAKTSVLDIGCVTVNRTFPTYTEQKLNAVGIEKFEHLINASSFTDQLIKLDISDPDFLNHPCFKTRFDLAVCLRGMINGFIDEQLRQQAWTNLAGLLSNSCVDYLLVDTFTNVQWYHKSDKGDCYNVASFIPPQYMYSRRELLTIFNVHNLELVEEIKEDFGEVTLAYFLLKLKK